MHHGFRTSGTSTTYDEEQVKDIEYRLMMIGLSIILPGGKPQVAFCFPATLSIPNQQISFQLVLINLREEVQ